MKVLVTGAGALLGQGIIRALRRSTLNATIVAADPSPLSAGLYWADRAHLLPMARDGRYLDRLRDLIAVERPDVVIPGTDVELKTLAVNRAAIEKDLETHVIISAPDVIDVADDKWLTATFLGQKGLDPVPSCLPGDEERLIDEVGFPLIVKPRVGARSIGFRKIHDLKTLREAIDDDPGVVIQKCIGSDDTEYTAGTLTFDGVCRASIVMRRDLRDGNTYRAFTQPYGVLNRFVEKAAVALGAYGPANFQFRLDAGVPRIFEINGRFSGTTAIRLHAGFNEVEMCLRHVVFGEPVVQPELEPVTILRHWSETVVRDDNIIAG
ncbi:ATP-grasp domain-containing protein [Rhizobium sp. TRM95111]|uniref:ATP-grasp domain-containing protein n=1 Tax=Rhizobium alarense TaxID=2846851 RepID=UPI001F4177B2|nr:ATP-grasp domain-containing protein [Rhizobium alarense]MCF3641812.1 ATP-grasp domain-containing protein [Rhizobium alarense]